MAEQVPCGREIEILKILWELGSASVRETPSLALRVVGPTSMEN